MKNIIEQIKDAEGNERTELLIHHQERLIELAEMGLALSKSAGKLDTKIGGVLATMLGKHFHEDYWKNRLEEIMDAQDEMRYDLINLETLNRKCTKFLGV